MKRMHVHISVNDLDTSIRFYSELFAAAPAVRKAGYAKWMLEDPRGVQWETFLTSGESTTYGHDPLRTVTGERPEPPSGAPSCCGPRAT